MEPEHPACLCLKTAHLYPQNEPDHGIGRARERQAAAINRTALFVAHDCPQVCVAAGFSLRLDGTGREQVGAGFSLRLDGTSREQVGKALACGYSEFQPTPFRK